ncbi:MAG: hypothetical protein ACTHLU_03095 [Novosphingobium sp.]
MDYLGPALTRKSDGLDAFAGMQQIGGNLTATAGTSAAFTGIPARFSHLLVEVLGISHDSGSTQSLRLELSPDGGTWTAPFNVGAAVGASAPLYGNIPILGYRRGAGAIPIALGAVSADNTALNSGLFSMQWRISAGIAAIRFSWTGSANFDATGVELFKLHGF